MIIEQSLGGVFDLLTIFVIKLGRIGGPSLRHTVGRQRGLFVNQRGEIGMTPSLPCERHF
jgi:hypothetical protein